MPKDLVELARICVKQSRASSHPEVAAELVRMAKEYECRAATKAFRQIDDAELDELLRLLNLFAAAPSLKCIEAMRWVESPNSPPRDGWHGRMGGYELNP